MIFSSHIFCPTLIKQLKGSSLCYGNSGFFHDLIFVEVSDLDGIVWFIIGLVCELFRSC